MADSPTISGVRGRQVTLNGRPITAFAGVTVADPNSGAVETVGIGLYQEGVPATLRDGAGYSGLVVKPFIPGQLKNISYYSLQGTASQVTSELDALVLTPAAPDQNSGDFATTIDFADENSLGASSADQQITIENRRVDVSGSRIVDVQGSNQTVDFQPYGIAFNAHRAGTNFIFEAGDGIDVVRGFRIGGAGHDTVSLPASDFTSLADVFRNTGDVGGSAFITDPKTGDAVRLAGVTTAELKQHAEDFAFL